MKSSKIDRSEVRFWYELTASLIGYAIVVYKGHRSDKDIPVYAASSAHVLADKVFDKKKEESNGK